MCRRALSSIISGLLSAATAAVAAQGAYLYTAQSTPYHPPDSPRFWYGEDLNEHNEIAGFYYATSTLSGRYYVSGTDFAVELGGGHYSWSILHGLNNNRFAVGQKMLPYWIDPIGAARAVLVHPDSEQHPEQYLGSLVGADGDANALDLNDANVAVGESMTAAGTTRAARFETDGSVTDLGTLGGTNSSATSINNRGDIVGAAQNREGHWRAFLIPSRGSMLDLGTLGGKESRAHRINNRGQIVGEADTPEGARHAFLFTDGRMEDLGTIYGTNSAAHGINDHGVIVGSSGAAFVKYPGEPIIELKKLVLVPREELLTFAPAINNSGVILARFYGGGTVMYTRLLQPGALSLEQRGSEYRVTFGAPPGTGFRLQRSGSLSEWTPVLTNTTSLTGITHVEASETAPIFFRAIITSLPYSQ